MAALTYKKTTTEKVTLKGVLDSDSKTMDCDGEEVKIQEYLDKFAGVYVEISIAAKSEEDLMEGNE